jgi:hypothetical protein
VGLNWAYNLRGYRHSAKIYINPFILRSSVIKPRFFFISDHKSNIKI